MKTKRYAFIALTLTVLALDGRVIADVVIFDGTLKNGGTFWAEGGGETVISSDLSYNSHDVLKINPGTNNYATGGLNMNPDLTIPLDATTLRIPVYIPTGSTFGSFKIDTSTYGATFNFNNTQGSWTVNDSEGNTSLLTKDAWHVVELDLTSIPDTVPGTSKLDFRIGMQRNGAGTNNPNYFYMGEVTLVPEPSSVLLLVAGLSGLLVLHRRR